GASTGTGSAGTGSTGTGTGSAGTGTGSAGTGTGSAGTGTGSAGTQIGSDTGHPVTPTLPEEIQIRVSSSPPGARISVDNAEPGKTTPAKLGMPKGSHPVSITLRLKGYEPYTFKSVDANEASNQSTDLVKIRMTTQTVKCKTPERSGCPRDAKGCC